MSELKVQAIACEIEPMVQIEEIRADFSARLKKALASQGIHQWGAGARLAKITAVTPKAASKWLNGEAIPGAAKLQALADALDVRAEWLQYGSGEGPGVFEENPDGDTPKTTSAELVSQMLAKHGKGLSAEARKRIVDAATDPAPSIGYLPAKPDTDGMVGDEVWIAHYDVRAAMGGGQIPHDYPEMFQDVRVSPKHLREMGVEFAEHYHLKMVTGWGQSMAPTIKHRDPVLVDVTIREFVGDGVYLFSYGELLYIKRLQMKGLDHYRMLSDNDRHKPEEIRVDDTHIQAKVLYVWNGHLL